MVRRREDGRSVVESAKRLGKRDLGMEMRKAAENGGRQDRQDEVRSRAVSWWY